MTDENHKASRPFTFTKMVCGFSFRQYDGDGPLQVLLVKKLRGPPGVIHRWNGPGGKVRGKGLDESSQQAMVREFAEETGAITQVEDWRRFVEFRFNGGCVHFYVHMKSELPGLKTGSESPTDEIVHWMKATELHDWTWALSKAWPASNLSWLIPLAIEVLAGAHLELPIVVSDKT